jgi:hypothetical protein
MKLDRLEMEALYENLDKCKQATSQAQEKLNNTIQNRLNEIAGVIIASFGFNPYDKKGNQLYDITIQCYCASCSCDPEYNTGDECVYDNLERHMDTGHILISYKYGCLSSGIYDYRSKIPSTFLYMDDIEISQHIEQEIESHKNRKTKSKLTREKNKQEKEKAKQAILSKLTDDEKKILGIKI